MNEIKFIVKKIKFIEIKFIVSWMKSNSLLMNEWNKIIVNEGMK